MVPLLAIALGAGLDEPVERGRVEDEVPLLEALFDAPERVEFPVGLGLTVTVVIVVLEKYTVEVERAPAPMTVPLAFGDAVIDAVLSAPVERLTPVAWATPAARVLFEKSATDAELLLAEGESVA